MTAGFITFSYPNNASAQMCFQEGAELFGDTLQDEVTQFVLTAAHIKVEFFSWEWFLKERVFMAHILPAMAMMTEEMSQIAMQQMQIIGSFIDAEYLMETQALMQSMEYNPLKDYGISEGVCSFATVTRSLAASERHSIPNALSIGKRSRERQLGFINTSGAAGEGADRKYRLTQFKRNYCDLHDNNNGLETMCLSPTPRKMAGIPLPLLDPPLPDRLNNDINYSKVIDRKLTLDLDLCNFAGIDNNGREVCAPTLYTKEDEQDPIEEDEQDIFALQSNLYSHDLFMRLPESSFITANPASLPSYTNQTKYMDIRSVIAKRSVAENSFNIITAMKSKGSPDNNPSSVTSSLTFEYMKPLLRELGMTDETFLDNMYGERPSYYAQMEVLTKKVFQRPEFYTNLYDKPANVLRKSVALQAIDLMQDLDTLKSYLRTEAMLSVLLELELIKLQEQLDNSAGRLTDGSPDRLKPPLPPLPPEPPAPPPPPPPFPILPPPPPPPPPDVCPRQLMTWTDSNTGLTCEGYVEETVVGGNGTATDVNDPNDATDNYGSANFTCGGTAPPPPPPPPPPAPIDGECGLSSGPQYSCAAGTSNSSAYADTSTEYRWRCDGINGGNNSVMCTKPKPPPPNTCPAASLRTTGSPRACHVCDIAGTGAPYPVGTTCGECPTGGSCRYECTATGWRRLSHSCQNF
jgi:hypothetical protein